MKINLNNPKAEKLFNYDTEAWENEIMKNNPSCVHHLIELEKNNPLSDEAIDKAIHS